MDAENRNANGPKVQSSTAEVLHDVFLVKGRTPDDDPSPEQIEIYRRMTPGRRLEIAERLYWWARRMKWAWLRTQQPAWTDAEVEAEVTHNFSHAGS